MKSVAHTLLLRIAPIIILILVALKASGMLVPSKATPRQLATMFLEETIPAASGDTTAALFANVAPAWGLDFPHDNALRGNFYLPEEMGPGAGFLDADGDGDLDIFVAGGGAITDDGPVQTGRLYRNDGDRFTDVTEQTGAGLPGPAYGVACADYDADGDEDIFVTRLGPDALLRNERSEQGRLFFTEVAASAGVDDDGFGTSAVFFDYDRDGWLDLYVARYVGWSVARENACYTILGARDYCNPINYEAPLTDRLYRNLGDGRFEDASDATGVGAATGNGLGVMTTDFDGDGWPDVYVANDQTPAFLWHNNGDGTFSETALVAGCAYDARGVAIAGMGVAAEDMDGDADIDLLVTNIHDQANLVLSNSGGWFQDDSQRMGLGRFTIPATAFGVALFDQDHDGELDVFFANGEVNINNQMRVSDNPYAQPNQFARLRDGQFIDATAESGAAFDGSSRGLAAADFDNDGDVDLLVTNNGGPLRLLRNDRTSGHWLGVEARTRAGAGETAAVRTAIGARVLVTAGGRTWMREIRPQQSYLSSGDPRAHFGLGSMSTVERVEVVWPDGSRSERRDVAADQYIVIEQEAGL